MIPNSALNSAFATRLLGLRTRSARGKPFALGRYPRQPSLSCGGGPIFPQPFPFTFPATPSGLGDALSTARSR